MYLKPDDGFDVSSLYFARSQIAVFWRRYFMRDALFKTKDIVILRSS